MGERNQERISQIDTELKKKSRLEIEDTYFLFLLRLSRPPVESNSDASSVAGFLEARKSEIRRYFAEIDI
mgnify:CR=1 FL=1